MTAAPASVELDGTALKKTGVPVSLGLDFCEAAGESGVESMFPPQGLNTS